jgi:hypothetical protein
MIEGIESISQDLRYHLIQNIPEINGPIIKDTNGSFNFWNECNIGGIDRGIQLTSIKKMKHRNAYLWLDSFPILLIEIY